MPLRCVVCEAAVGEPHYANAWERARAAFPCCSAACAQTFDPDVHWLPATAPAPLDDGETRRLLAVARKRIEQGDRPRVVVREMLQAGMAVAPLRGALIEGRAAKEASEKTAKRVGVAGLMLGVFTGRWRFAQSRDKRDLAAIDEGAGDLDRWEARFAAC